MGLGPVILSPCDLDLQLSGLLVPATPVSLKHKQHLGEALSSCDPKLGVTMLSEHIVLTVSSSCPMLGFDPTRVGYKDIFKASVCLI